MEGKFAFGFINGTDKTAPVLDSTYGSITLKVQRFDGRRVIASEKEIELTSLSRERHPEYFYEGSNVMPMSDTMGLYTVKDFSDLVL